MTEESDPSDIDPRYLEAKAEAWQRWKRESDAFGTCPTCGHALANESDSDCAERMDPELFFGRDRGIPREIWEGRYTWYSPENPEPVLEAVADLQSDQQRFAAKLAGDCHGWLINRRPLPMLPWPPKMYPELKPLHPVRTDGPTLHWHGDGEPAEWLPDFVKKRMPLNRYIWLPEPAEWLPDFVKESMPSKLDLWRSHIERPKKKNWDAHDGANTEALHYHWPPAKYVHLTNATTLEYGWPHDHEKSYKLERNLRRHLAHHEHPYGLIGEHFHFHDEPRKVRDSSVPKMAQRIDAHKLAAPLVRRSPVVFFCIEGCIKADSILSDGGAAISVPAVGQWFAEELRDLVDAFLVGMTAIVVCDADWRANSLVINEARLCENWLRKFGVGMTYVAAPPLGFNGMDTKGVDDLIGAGGHLEDLLVVERKMSPHVEPFIAGLKKNKRRNGDALMNLASYVGPSGYHHASLRRTGAAMGMNYRTVHRAIEELDELGALKWYGEPNTKVNHWSRRLEWSSKPPRLVLASHLCPEDLPERRLDQVHGGHLSIRLP